MIVPNPSEHKVPSPEQPAPTRERPFLSATIVRRAAELITNGAPIEVTDTSKKAYHRALATIAVTLNNPNPMDAYELAQRLVRVAATRSGEGGFGRGDQANMGHVAELIALAQRIIRYTDRKAAKGGAA